MKSRTIIVFIGLKIAEVLTLLFTPYGVGLWNPFYITVSESNVFTIWCTGFLTILLSGFAVAGIVVMAIANWNLAKSICRKNTRWNDE